jgi:hypothetical protein
VNTITWLKYIPSWLPGAAWKRTANDWRNEVDQMVNIPYNWAKGQIVSDIYVWIAIFLMNESGEWQRSTFNYQSDAESPGY